MKAKADKYFQKFIRLRDKGKPCITCGEYRTLECGHFISRRFDSTRYDEKNAHGQCAKCNRFEYGNQFEHGTQIDLRYGKGTADLLLMKSKMLSKRTRIDYERIANFYKDKCKQLEK